MGTGTGTGTVTGSRNWDTSNANERHYRCGDREREKAKTCNQTGPVQVGQDLARRPPGSIPSLLRGRKESPDAYIEVSMGG
jgi:hypothetical protein